MWWKFHLRVVGDLLETNSHNKAQGLGLKQTWLILQRSTPCNLNKSLGSRAT